jgi:lysophospholipase L1-like esterase
MKGLEIAGVKANKLPAGISGNKSNSMLARLEKDVLSKKPQWMTFSCGVNDVWHGRTGVKLEQYKENVTKIFDMCASNGVKVIVLTATMIGEDANNDNNKKLVAYNEWLRDEAKRRNLRIADLNADMQSTLAEIRKTDKTQGNKLTRDGVHMAYKGNVMMAWGVLRAMGLDESMKKAVLSEFDNIPGAYNVAIKLSVKEYSDLVSKFKCDDKKLQEYAREKLLK